VAVLVIVGMVVLVGVAVMVPVFVVVGVNVLVGDGPELVACVGTAVFGTEVLVGYGIDIVDIVVGLCTAVSWTGVADKPGF
jgi:hypothetical protein